jgi:hypothetical protein
MSTKNEKNALTPEEAERLDDLCLLLKRANDRTWSDRSTGFVPMRLEHLMEFMKVVKASASEKPISLELGCGTASWTLMAAAMGYPSYAIDINPHLVDEAKRSRDKAKKWGIIDPSTPCEFALGNFFTEKYLTEQKRFIQDNCHFEGAWKKQGNPYKELGIDIKDAGIIYTWPWPEEIQVPSDFLAREAAESTIIILPYYYSQRILKTKPLSRRDEFSFGDVMIGTKINVKSQPKTTFEEHSSVTYRDGDGVLHVIDSDESPFTIGGIEYRLGDRIKMNRYSDELYKFTKNGSEGTILGNLVQNGEPFLYINFTKLTGRESHRVPVAYNVSPHCVDVLPK